ncbi:MAG: hypothetical protein HKM29_03210 [Deltaproteobacteria bacterium]|nr:hypothetical protein [Deltaproteobacteria bacterium]
MARKSFADSLTGLALALARNADAWTAQGQDGTYDGETIYDYIDGAGEVYRAYNMRGCLSRRYTAAGEPAIVLDIFDMGSSEDSFGVFTHDREGKPADVGQDSLYRQGWLSFWKGRFFVSLYMERETVAAKEAAFRLARAVDSLIGEEGRKPTILGRLPREGLEDRSVRYFHHFMILNYHYYLSDENILDLGRETDVLLASYRRGGKRARLLLVHYPDPKRAKRANERFLAHYLPEAGEKNAIRLENGKWSAATRKGRLLAVVLEAGSRSLAEGLLKEVEKGP